MRNGLIRFMGMVALPSAMAVGGCADYSSSSSNTGGTGSSAGGGGSTGGASGTTGGSSGTGGASSTDCTNVSACGGDIVGKWNVTASCLKVSGTMDVSNFGLGCTTVTVTGSLTVTGSIEIGNDGTITDNTTVTGDEQLVVPAACLFVSGTTTTCDRVGNPMTIYTPVTCQDASGGGCNCSGHVDQQGGMGYVSTAPLTSGNYTTSGNAFSTTDGRNEIPYDYCVSGSTLTLTPQTTAKSVGTLTGTVTFQKQ